MKKYVDGQYIEMTQEEIEALKNDVPPVPYKDRVIDRIRAKYSVDDELAILRQKDTKFEEWIEYNTFVENVKLEEKIKEQNI